MGVERRGPAVQRSKGDNRRRDDRTENAKPYQISKREVYDAWKRVQRNRGAGGVDEESIDDFEGNLGNNLYTVWNRMASGSYFPKPVRRVEIPKPDGRKRPLGIPTVKDRIAQEVVRARLERILEPLFHEESYGFRPNRSTEMAIANCRERCFRLDWVIDVDIEQFFDTIRHDLLMKAVERHSPERWMTLYIRRWLEAGTASEGGVTYSERGTPQGGVISPLLANLFLHYAFDLWMKRTYPNVMFERYADDIVIHCESETQSQEVKAALENRLAEVGLRLHPDKTRVVYCKDKWRREEHDSVSFTFLGYTFQPRPATSRYRSGRFTGFLPAAGTKAKQALRTKLRARKLFRNTTLSVRELADGLNPIVRGWLNYFTKFYPSGVNDIISGLNYRLVGWLSRKRRFSQRKALALLARLRREEPKLFAHWLFQLSRG